MPIKNYTTKVPATQSVREINDILVKHGAKSIMTDYEQGTGNIEAIKFLIHFNGKDIAFRLPIDWKKFQAVLKANRVAKWRDDVYCHRVAWRVLRDWVDAQMAIYETEMVELPQIFLPYAMSGEKTFYEIVQQNNLLSSPD